MSPLTVFCLVALVVGIALSEETQLDSDPNFDFFNEWEGRIIGGSTAQPGQFPHQVGLSRLNGVFYCSGSILNARFVLTAAQCFHVAGTPRDFRLVVGAHNRFGGGIVHTIAGTLTHPLYNRPRFAHDIGIIRTANPIQLNSIYVRAIRLPTQAPPDNFPLAVSGWGNVNRNGPAAEVLQYKISVSLNRQTCQQQFGRLGDYVYSTSLCVSNPPGRGICFGDGGNPLIGRDGAQYGIAIWSRPCAHGYPDVYTDVFSFVPWIQSVIE